MKTVTDTGYSDRVAAVAQEAADYITSGECEWGQWHSAGPGLSGRVRIDGAVRRSRDVVAAVLLDRVLIRRGRSKEWNNAPGRTEEDVVAYLREVQVTDGEIAETVGPDWGAVQPFVERVAALSDEEMKNIALSEDGFNGPCSPWNSAGMPATFAYADKRRFYLDSLNAVGELLGVPMRLRSEVSLACLAEDVASLKGEEAMRRFVWKDRGGVLDLEDAAFNAAVGLLVRDGLAESHYQHLIAPWLLVEGGLHPEDDKSRPSLRSSRAATAEATQWLSTLDPETMETRHLRASATGPSSGVGEVLEVRRHPDDADARYFITLGHRSEDDPEWLPEVLCAGSTPETALDHADVEEFLLITQTVRIREGARLGQMRHSATVTRDAVRKVTGTLPSRATAPSPRGRFKRLLGWVGAGSR